MEEREIKKVPFDIIDVDAKLGEELMSYFKGEHSGFVRAGPKGYFFPKKYRQEAANIYNLEVRPSDVFIVTYPRSGTTWTQELVWLVANDLDYTKAAETPLVQRFPFIEHTVFFDPIMVKKLEELNKGHEDRLQAIRDIVSSSFELLTQAPSPRFIKSHMPLSLLPPNLLDAKVVFVARDPRDVAVSFYHHNRLINIHGYVGDLKRYWNYFINDLIYITPYIEYVKEGWEKRHHPNMLFLFYEELSNDLPATVRRVADFLEKELTEPQIERLSEHLRIDNFRKNKSVNEDAFKDFGIIVPGEESFIRKGKTGGWRNCFDAEMRAQAQRWMQHNLRDTDLRFPE